MNDATFQRFTQINDELVGLFNWLKQRGDLETASRLAPIVDSLTRLLIQILPPELVQARASDIHLSFGDVWAGRRGNGVYR